MIAGIAIAVHHTAIGVVVALIGLFIVFVGIVVGRKGSRP
jgi:hypothetical protein